MLKKVKQGIVQRNVLVVDFAVRVQQTTGLPYSVSLQLSEGTDPKEHEQALNYLSDLSGSPYVTNLSDIVSMYNGMYLLRNNCQAFAAKRAFDKVLSYLLGVELYKTL